MATQKGGYFLRDGTRVPSVTTILSRFKEAGPLMHWAWNEGKEGRDYRETRDKAADAGTLCHEAVEAWVRGEDFDWQHESPEVLERARKSFGAFLEWADQTQLTVEHAELPLVSETYRFGGTFDCILVKGKRAMGDWKTSNGVYGEYLAQLAAYGQLWSENYPELPIDGGFHLIRFDKTYGDFSHRYWPELDAGWRYFRALRTAYAETGELKRRAA